MAMKTETAEQYSEPTTAKLMNDAEALRVIIKDDPVIDRAKFYSDVRAKLKELDSTLSDALAALRGEKPEDMSVEEGRELTIERIEHYLRYGVFP